MADRLVEEARHRAEQVVVRSRRDYAQTTEVEEKLARDVLALADAVDELREAAQRVVTNAFGTKPRHTKARDGSCRDDCIPCGIEVLKQALDA